MALRFVRMLFSVCLAGGTLVGLLSVMGLWGAAVLPVYAQGGTGTIRVATTGADSAGCGDAATPCRSVQYAVDQASTGDAILVAAGVYTGVSPRVLDTSTMSQVVFISKTVVVRGGYSAGNWSSSNPDANPTILNAQGQGRVVVISGTASPTLENLVITGGDGAAAGPNVHCCGGFIVYRAAATISGCRIYSNTGRAAGGGALYYSPATIHKSVIVSNTASAEYGGAMAIWASDGFVVVGNHIFNNRAQKGGGGLDVYESDGTISGNIVWNNWALEENGGGLHISDGADTVITGNVIYANYAADGGGGIAVLSNTATVENNLVFSNTAGNRGGGVGLFVSRATVVSNTIFANTAKEEGGGVCVDRSRSQLRANSVLGNTTGQRGGGIVLSSQNNLTLINNVVARNHLTATSDAHGAGIFIYGSQVLLIHSTIADNTGGEGNEGVHITGAGADVSTAQFTNTIFAGQDAALEINTANTAIVNGALWFDVNQVSRGGPGYIITVTNDYVGNPRFVNRVAGDYHISRGSAALDRGLPAGVADDRDDSPRPVGSGPDLGAYEYQSAARDLFLPVVRKQ